MHRDRLQLGTWLRCVIRDRIFWGTCVSHRCRGCRSRREFHSQVTRHRDCQLVRSIVWTYRMVSSSICVQNNNKQQTTNNKQQTTNNAHCFCASPVARWTTACCLAARAAVDRPGPGHVYAPLLKRTEDGQGRGVGERVELHGDDLEDPHSPGGRYPVLCHGRG